MNLYFIFNKNTKELIGMTLDEDSIPKHALFRVVTITEDDDIKDISWEGDYATGKMIRLGESNAIVTEYDLEGKFYDRLFRKFPGEEIFVKILDWMAGDKESAADLIEFHKKNKDKLNKEIEFFKNSDQHKYISKEEDKKNTERRFQV